MTDLEDLRKRYADFMRHCVCGATWEASEYTVLHQCPSCDGYETWQATRDPAVLALCDEVEALRAKVPEVLREWPAKEEDAPGEWVYVFRGKSAYRGWFSEPARHDDESCGRPLFVNVDGHASFCAYFEPGEFFVRVPA